MPFFSIKFLFTTEPLLLRGKKTFLIEPCIWVGVKFKQVAFPYCLTNAIVTMVNKIINTNPNDYKVHTMNDNYRILKGIIAAKLNNNPDLEEVIRIYGKQIVDRDMYNATGNEQIKKYTANHRNKY
jgi:hypothetical protein